jgi:polyisoprenoid-binding protein YceI
MKRILYILFVVLALTGYAFVTYFQQSWDLTAGCSVKFINPEATGSFGNLTSKIVFDERDLSSAKFEVSIDVSSIDIGSPEMNKQALSPDMLSAKKFPKIYFVSTSVTKTTSGYSTSGTLELHGVKKEIAIPFTFQGKIFKGSFEIKAKDYGINSLGNGAEDVLKIELSVPVTEFSNRGK